jgi:hypothetical protein
MQSPSRVPSKFVHDIESTCMKLYSHHRCLGLTTGLLAFGLLAAAAQVSFAQTATIFQNFAGTSFDQAGNGVPPDTMGAMGVNNQFAEFINGSFANFNTSNGSLVSRVSDSTFWQNAGLSSGSLGGGLSDPRLLFDVPTQRWFATEITTPAHSNAFLVAVSNTANLTQGFKGYTFQTNPATGSQNLFADYDMLGINGDGVYIGANNFTSSTGNDVSSSILSISKADLIAKAVTPASHLFYSNNGNSTGYLPHPVTDLDASQDIGQAYFLSEFNQNTVALSSLSGPGANPAGETLTASGGNVAIASNPEPPSAGQPGAPDSISTNDSRFSGAVIKRNGFLWGVQESQQNGKVALHWEQIDPTTKTIVHEGFISDAAHDYYYGSIAVNAAGAIVIGYTRSGETEFPSTYASVGKLDSSGVSFNAPLLLKQSATLYNAFDKSPHRWGDYTNTVVDPSDPTKFWTIQEFSDTSGHYGTQITGIQVDAVPETASSVSLGLLLTLGGLTLFLRKCKAQNVSRTPPRNR